MIMEQKIDFTYKEETGAQPEECEMVSDIESLEELFDIPVLGAVPHWPVRQGWFWRRKGRDTASMKREECRDGGQE